MLTQCCGLLTQCCGLLTQCCGMFTQHVVACLRNTLTALRVVIARPEQRKQPKLFVKNNEKNIDFVETVLTNNRKNRNK